VARGGDARGAAAGYRLARWPSPLGIAAAAGYRRGRWPSPRPLGIAVARPLAIAVARGGAWW